MRIQDTEKTRPYYLDFGIFGRRSPCRTCGSLVQRGVGTSEPHVLRLDLELNLPKSNYVSRFTFHASRFQQRLVLMLAISCGVFPAAIGIADEMGVDYYDPINVLKFADALYGDGDYLRAAGEYQRYLFYKPQDADHILYRIAVSYRLGGRAGRALQFLEKILGEYPQSDFTSLARYEIGYSYFLMRAYDQSLRFLNETQDLIRDENYRWKSRQLIGLNYLMLKRWEDAGRLFNQFDLETVPLDLQETVPLYRKYAQAGKRLPSKSPILAGLFSAIVPGTGKLYARQTGDALFTVLVLALTGWQAYDGFHRNGTASTKGWVFGTLSGFFYLGNVYGSVVAAQVHNRRVEEEFLATIPTEIP